MLRRQYLLQVRLIIQKHVKIVLVYKKTFKQKQAILINFIKVNQCKLINCSCIPERNNCYNWRLFSVTTVDHGFLYRQNFGFHVQVEFKHLR